MSYQVLARKWRPANFSQVAGQAHVLKSLINALDNQRLHHAYLFTGTRGVGKTTLARILAKCLNCEQGVSSKPCGVCDSCREISEGRFIDLIEVDAASRTKVEDTRELLDNVQYAPSRGRFKVYLIDEVHMLSNHSFNALLKTLEEPPPHVKFLFATTDPQKLPITILSRCLQFNLKNLSPQLIVKYLQTVLQEEKVEFEDEALWQIASAASGSMRDALTLVDQAISYCQGKVEAKGVVEMLGVPPQQQVYQLLKGLASKDAALVLSLINEVSQQSPDYIHTLDKLLSSLHRIAMAQLDPNIVDNSYGDKQQIVELAQQITAEDVQLYYQMGLKGRDDLRLSGEIRTAFEMLLVRMLVFSPDYVVPDNNMEALEGEKKKTSEPGDELSEVFQESANGEGACLSSGELSTANWLEIFPKLQITGIAANILANSIVKSVDGLHFCFILDRTQSAVYSEEILPKINQAFSDFYSKEIVVEIQIDDIDTETPARLAARLKAEQYTEIVRDFEEDENVQELLGQFSGRLINDSIVEVDQ